MSFQGRIRDCVEIAMSIVHGDREGVRRELATFEKVRYNLRNRPNDVVLPEVPQLRVPVSSHGIVGRPEPVVGEDAKAVPIAPAG